MIWPMILGMLGIASVAVYFGIRTPASQATIDDRLARISERTFTLEEMELSQPFFDRVITPTFGKVTRSLSRLTPQSNSGRLRHQLEMAGAPSRLGVAEFTGLKVALAAVSGGLIFLLFAVSGAALTSLLLFPITVGAIAFISPGIWLSRKIKSRRKSIQLSLADAIDLLTISVEAGLGFDPALQRVADKWDNDLTREFGRMLHEMRIGKSRREAMREMAKRCDVDDVTSFVSSIIQADQLGVSITQVLRTQSRQIRVRRRQRAEEKAHKAPIKMLFPMVFLIFPAVYAVILGPAIPQILNGL